MTKDNDIVEFEEVASVGDIEIGKAKRFIVEGTPVAVFHLEEGFRAIEDTCSHAGASLTYGQLEDGCIVACPRHGARFDINTGRVVSLPAVRGVKSYRVKVEEDTIYVSKTPVNDEEPEIMRIV